MASFKFYFKKFFLVRSAESCLNYLNDDKSLKFNATWARPPTKSSASPNNAGHQQKRGNGERGDGLLPTPKNTRPFLAPPGTLYPNDDAAAPISNKLKNLNIKSPRKPQSHQEETRQNGNSMVIQEQQEESTSTLDIPQTGPCNYCCKLASFRCQRCADFYCGQQCQINDWQKHKPMCFPMP